MLKMRSSCWLKIILLPFVAFVINACSDDFTPIENAVKDVGKPDGSRNPYTLENTLKALENLGYLDVADPNGRVASYDIRTHYYYKFSPTSIEQVIELEKLGYDFWETPLDEDVAAYEEANPGLQSSGSASTSEYGPLYTLVPYDYQLTQLALTIPSQLISTVVLLDDNSGDERDPVDPDTPTPRPSPDPWEPEPGPGQYCYDEYNAPYVCGTNPRAYLRADNTNKVSRVERVRKLLEDSGIDLNALERERLRITGHEDEADEVDFAEARQYRPSGQILVEDNSVQRNVPLMNTFIKTRRWFKLATTTTNAQGRFTIGKKYNNKVKLIIKFKNGLSTVRGISGALKLWEYVFPLKKVVGVYDRTNMENISYTLGYEKDGQTMKALWFAAGHFMNTLANMRTYCSTNGLPNPPDNLNVWVSDKITKRASAPMLRSISNSSQLIQAISYLFPNAGNIISTILTRYAPDITMRINPGDVTRNSREMIEIFFHELAHAVHYGQVGNAYWTDEIIYTVANNGYGQRNTPGFGRVAVVESWGNFIGFTFARNYYLPVTNSSGRALQDEYLRNLENQVRDDTEPLDVTTSGTRGWIPQGFLHDCIDTGEPAITGINDQVNGYNVAGLFRGFTPSATNMTILRQNILSANGNTQAIQVGTLLNGYGY